ncbi:uncharacterized protein [Pyrus communis]|uniref:uncharacterized protein n=1 Tax=Pyrus communis TaxID=23211 RepID=UPI0035C000AC
MGIDPEAFWPGAFKGNPAAVCLLEEDRDDQWLQVLAAEFNLSETCYLTWLTDSGSTPPFGICSWIEETWNRGSLEPSLLQHCEG